MKICWDNLEKLIFIKSLGKWRSDKWKYYEYVESCTYCGEPCFARDGNSQKEILSYCDRECVSKCSMQRKKQGESLSASWKDPSKRKYMILNTEKAVRAWKSKRRDEIRLINKDKKICSVCGKEKDIKCFSKDKRLIMQLASTCRSCQGKQYKQWICKDGNKEHRNKYARDRVNSNPKHKLNMRISNSIRNSIISGKNGQTWSLLVDYLIDDLMKHLEKQFSDGMTWENYGEWHIDHKIPISAHNFTKPEHRDFKRCWSLKNLQPMWASENISKGAKLERQFQPSLAI